MSEEQQFTVSTARRAGERDELNRWVADFLASPGSDNAPLGQQLTDPPRAWHGPVLVPLDQLHRLAGPPDHPVLRPTDDDDWRDDVDDLADKVDDGLEPPPVIATYRDGQLVLEDGNHRVEAMRRAGQDEAWTLIGFDDETARERWVDQSPSK